MEGAKDGAPAMEWYRNLSGRDDKIVARPSQ
jgi:hypothetical protein